MRLNPFTGAYLKNPASVWRELLDSTGSVHYAEDLDLWLITRYADVRQALGDADTYRNALTLAPVYPVHPDAMEIVMKIDAPPTTAAADAPTHPRTRRALRATFANTATRVQHRYGGIVRRRVDELVSRLSSRPGGTVDLVADFAVELPLLVVVDILGVPQGDVPQIKSWADGQIAIRWSTGCTPTSPGGSGATSSRCPPTARSVTSALAGWPTRRSSHRPPAATPTSRRSWPAGCGTWSTGRTPVAPSGTSHLSSPWTARRRRHGATPA